jgi:hypothetical protein
MKSTRVGDFSKILRQDLYRLDPCASEHSIERLSEPRPLPYRSSVKAAPIRRDKPDESCWKGAER